MLLRSVYMLLCLAAAARVAAVVAAAVTPGIAAAAAAEQKNKNDNDPEATAVSIPAEHNVSLSPRNKYSFRQCAVHMPAGAIAGMGSRRSCVIHLGHIMRRGGRWLLFQGERLCLIRN